MLLIRGGNLKRRICTIATGRKNEKAYCGSILGKIMLFNEKQSDQKKWSWSKTENSEKWNKRQLC